MLSLIKISLKITRKCSGKIITYYKAGFAKAKPGHAPSVADRETIPFVPHDKFLRNVIVAAEPIKTEFFWLSSLFNYLLGNVHAPEVSSGRNNTFV